MIIKKEEKKEKENNNNDITYEEIENFIKKYFTIYTEKLLKENMSYCEICFENIIKADYSSLNNINTDKISSTYGCVDFSCDEDDKFKIIYGFEDFSRILFEKQFKPVCEKIIHYIQYIVKHECYHILQFLWIKKHTSNWEKSMFELEFYNLNTPYEKREHEIEAKKASLNESNLKPFETYLSQFVF